MSSDTEDNINLDVGLCFYEYSLAPIKRLVESCKDHVRYIFAIDGKFEFLESDQLLSSQEVRDYLKSIPNVILEDHPNLKEPEKRQKYLNLATALKTDVLLQIDSDEWISDRTRWPEAKQAIERMWIMSNGQPQIKCVHTQLVGQEGDYPMLWINPHLIEYTKTHNFWRFADGTIYKSTADYPVVPHLFKRTNDKGRTPDLLDKTEKYQGKLIAYEKPYKTEYRKTARGHAV